VKSPSKNKVTTPKSCQSPQKQIVPTRQPRQPEHPKKAQSENYEVKVTHFVSPSEFHLQASDAGKTGLDQ